MPVCSDLKKNNVKVDSKLFFGAQLPRQQSSQQSSWSIIDFIKVCLYVVVIETLLAWEQLMINLICQLSNWEEIWITLYIIFIPEVFLSVLKFLV